VVKKRPASLENPEIEFTADVKARELCFETVPETEVRFFGSPDRESASGTDRKNLPEEVEPGVTYRDPEVRLRIASAIAGDAAGSRKEADTEQQSRVSQRRRK
jgi:hypothetical protein